MTKDRIVVVILGSILLGSGLTLLCAGMWFQDVDMITASSLMTFIGTAGLIGGLAAEAQ